MRWRNTRTGLKQKLNGTNTAITATFELDEDEVNAINAAYAEGVLRSVEVELSRG